MVVMTSLTDPAISDATILKIYAARWGVETLYRELKSCIAQSSTGISHPDFTEGEQLSFHRGSDPSFPGHVWEGRVRQGGQGRSRVAVERSEILDGPA
jgi:hypothetical protein